MTRFRTRILLTVLGLIVITVVWEHTPSPHATLFAQTGGGSANSNNQGVNAELVELREALADSQADLTTALAAIEQLQGAVASLQAKLQYVRVIDGEINGLAGPHFIVEGCNVHVRSGSGHTYELDSSTGRGNLIIGYNEDYDAGPRDGAHNVVIGQNHTYTSSSGLVAGASNTIAGDSPSVPGGVANVANAWYSTCSGGFGNEATEIYSTVNGGSDNHASGYIAVVSGGYSNEASGYAASVSGGQFNAAAGNFSSVSGGYERCGVSF